MALSRTPPLRLPEGFTLIEVMVALTVVAVSLAAGLKAAGALTQNTERLNDITIAQWCADNQLTSLKLNKQYPGVGDSDFKCVELGRTLAGKMVIRPTPNPNFRRVDAQVNDEAGRTVVTVSTILTRYPE